MNNDIYGIYLNIYYGPDDDLIPEAQFGPFYTIEEAQDYLSNLNSTVHYIQEWDEYIE